MEETKTLGERIEVDHYCKHNDHNYSITLDIPKETHIDISISEWRNSITIYGFDSIKDIRKLAYKLQEFADKIVEEELIQ